MAASRGSRETTISDLPPEILSHIFTFLPYNLKVVRLVCSKWNESCNTEKVSGHEKIAVNDIAMENIVKHLSSRKFLRNIYNFDLFGFGLSLETRHARFFEIYGGKLRSLQLDECGAVSECVPILQFCKNLNTLALKRCFPTIVRLFHHLDGSFVQTKIVSLRIKSREMWTDKTMNDCFRVCPNLSSFSYREPYDIEEKFYTASDISFSCIHQALVIRAANIVELNLSMVEPEQIEQIASIPNLKLRKLANPHIALTHRTMRNIVIQQPHLENIAIDYCSKTRVYGSEDWSWIERCSKLTHLKMVHWYRDFFWDRKLLDALTSRLHLRELVLKTRHISIAAVRSDLENSQRTFEHLRTLELELPDIDYDWFLANVSTNLNQLVLKGVNGISSEMLEFITNRFTHLETLKFKMNSQDLVKWTLNEDHSIERISFGNLGKLKELRIRSKYDDMLSCPTKLLMRFKAPNLRYLKLSRFKSIDATSLSDIAKNYPLLEYFNQRGCGYEVDPSYPSINSLMSECKRLSFFYLSGCDYVGLHRR